MEEAADALADVVSLHSFSVLERGYPSTYVAQVYEHRPGCGTTREKTQTATPMKTPLVTTQAILQNSDTLLTKTGETHEGLFASDGDEANSMALGPKRVKKRVACPLKHGSVSPCESRKAHDGFVTDEEGEGGVDISPDPDRDESPTRKVGQQSTRVQMAAAERRLRLALGPGGAGNSGSRIPKGAAGEDPRWIYEQGSESGETLTRIPSDASSRPRADSLTWTLDTAVDSSQTGQHLGSTIDEEGQDLRNAPSELEEVGRPTQTIVKVSPRSIEPTSHNFSGSFICVGGHQHFGGVYHSSGSMTFGG